MADPALVDTQLERVADVIRPQLTKEELETFEIRPSVSHGDIEVLLGGRMYWLDSAHLTKVEECQRIDNPEAMKLLGTHILERLRGKKFLSSTTTDVYDGRKVAREINYVLVNLYANILPPEEEKKLDDFLHRKLKEVFRLSEEPKEYDAGHYRLLNRLIVSYLVQYTKRVRK